MRLKLDENLPHDLADELARRGHDVDTVLDKTSAAGRTRWSSKRRQKRIA